MGDDPKGDEIFMWAHRKPTELKPGVKGLDWVSLAVRLYEDEVAEEAERLFPGCSEGAHEEEEVGLVFFHLLDLIS